MNTLLVFVTHSLERASLTPDPQMLSFDLTVQAYENLTLEVTNLGTTVIRDRPQMPKVRSLRTKLLLAFLSLWVANCARSPLKNSDEALRVARTSPPWGDDLNYEGLKDSIQQQIVQHRQAQTPLQFGKRRIDRRIYIEKLEALVAALNRGPQDFQKQLTEDFEIHEVYGAQSYGDVFLTSYFEPVLKASKKPKGNLTQPLYLTPKDLVVVDLKAFQSRFPSLSSLQRSEQKSIGPLLRGRLYSEGDDSVPRIVPYYDRREIDELGLLKGKKLEIAYVDPIEAFILQIQGSGTLEFDSQNRLKVGYGAQNGHPYVAVGLALKDRIPVEQMTLYKIEKTLREMSPDQRQAILNTNPSYVFFSLPKMPAPTFFGTSAIAGRTIATDASLFPKGVLAFLQFNKPVLDEKAEGDQVLSQQWVSRFVVDHDTGGAIRGPGRVDLFWGSGDLAKRYAGVMKTRGRLFYFVPKDK